MDTSYDGSGWGAYFKDMLGKAWTQSIRTLSLTMPEEDEEGGHREYTRSAKSGPQPKRRPARVAMSASGGTKKIERI